MTGMKTVAIFLAAFLTLVSPSHLFAGSKAENTNFIPKTLSRAKICKVCTELIDRRTIVCRACGPDGKIYTYTVVEITYRDTFSDGSVRIWKTSI